MVNALVGEQSPYLLQHAGNPVDWLPWGEEAFRLAKESDKPIFLSIGYSTCHWCHVMERESFEDEGIAGILNEYFVAVKVDREERPDIDLTYMHFVQATTGHGGWPMSVFLTPDRQPFYGGTYFPPEDRLGRIGFASLLRRIAGLWEEKRGELVEQAMGLTERLRGVALAASAVESGEGWEEIGGGAIERFGGYFDKELGGFGGAPKFPRPVVMRLLFVLSGCEGLEAGQRERARRMALRTLEAIEAGGIHDHIGGGYHRYSVDRYWHIPHYEKMLYDQGQILEVMVDAWQMTGEQRWVKATEELVAYVLRDMRHGEGGFFSAEDADSLGVEGEKREGAYYIWRVEEIAGVLEDPREFALFSAAYGIEEGGNTRMESDPHGELKGTNTLYRARGAGDLAAAFGMFEGEVEEALERMREKLRLARALRSRPHLDDKILAGWNGLMIGALARAAAVFERPEWLEAAVHAAGFIREKMWEEGRLYRSYRQKRSGIPAFAGDYAALVHGLLEIYEAGGEVGWLRWAIALQECQDVLFGDESDGGYFSVREEDGGLFSMKEDNDGAEAAPESLAVHNLLRLECVLQDGAYGKAAGRLLESRRAFVASQPTAMPWFLAAGVLAGGGRWHVTVAGGGTAEGRRVISALRRQWHPGSALVLWPVAEDEMGWALERWPHLAGVCGRDVRIFACNENGCQEGLEGTSFVDGVRED